VKLEASSCQSEDHYSVDIALSFFSSLIYFYPNLVFALDAGEAFLVVDRILGNLLLSLEDFAIAPTGMEWMESELSFSYSLSLSFISLYCLI
jgi:hypothetical protein